MFGGLTKMKYLCTRLQEQGFGFESQRSHNTQIAK